MIAVVLAFQSILILLAVAQGATAPDTFSGRVTDSAGHPLPGAEVTVSGTTDGGQHAVFEQRTDSQGRYSIRVPRGVYTARAYGNVVRNGQAYRLVLHPTDNDATKPYDSKSGAVKNFVLRLSGMKAFRNLDPERPESYYGGSIQIAFSDPMRTGLDAYAVFAQEAVIEILLTPVGALLDGSAAHPLQFKRRASSQSSEQRIVNIPAARYVLTARAWHPGRSAVPLRVAAAVHEGGRPTPLAKSVEIDFQPSRLLGPSSDGFEPITLHIMNGTDGVKR
jgi:hypothetical protein